MSHVRVEVSGKAGQLTLDRPNALNALSLEMIRDLTTALLEWRDDPGIELVAFRGMGRQGPFGNFCAGGDIRFFHQAVFAGDPRLEDYFTEEYTLNHLVHRYRKPCVAFMDGIVMGGGMGISQGTRYRVVTERTKMAMPETNIGLFPDVGGGYFLSRCPGRIGEYLALTGEMIGGADAMEATLADVMLPSADLPSLWNQLAAGSSALPRPGRAEGSSLGADRASIDRVFSLRTVTEMVAALEADRTEWAAKTLAALRKRSPLMLHVTLEQVRRARSMDLAADLRMERDMMRRCFHLRPGPASETVEGIRALVVDKDNAPRWNPSRVEDVTPEMVDAFFESPWPAHAHPLRTLD